ncbi:MAG: DUF4249 domain-containing protein [Bacteroidetes bacterium]|nr:MAG: DUF4249 domain-containing protein [Bacteroidota bacterium]
MTEKTIYKNAFVRFYRAAIHTAFRSKVMQHFLVVTVALFLLTGCEDFFTSEATNVKIPGSEPQLVVYSFISPQDSLIRVIVYRSIPNTIDPRNVPHVFGDAHVHLAKKGDAFTQLSYDEDLMAFVINADDFSVEAGNDYILRVEAFSGETVEAICYVPGFEVDTVMLYEPTQTTDQWGSTRTNIQWEVHPTPSSEVRYYRSGAYSTAWEIFENQHQLLLNISPLWLDRGQEFFTYTNETAPVFRASSRFHLNLQNGTSNTPESTRIDSLFVFVMQTDYHYYQFHRSVENYFYFDDDFPFAEAVHIYSNIQGGLGVFGGYNKRLLLVAATPQGDE